MGDGHDCDPILEIKNASIKLIISYKLLNRMTFFNKIKSYNFITNDNLRD